MKTDAIVAYTYRAEILCQRCTTRATFRDIIGEDLLGEWNNQRHAEQILRLLARLQEIDRDESTYDSGDFPKVVFADQTSPEEACDSCGENLLESYSA